jgi:glyoxylase-like metal-dependent hydrolase (beta-lactamase superfamily II)
MTSFWARRDLLRGVAAAAASVALPGTAPAQPPLQLIELGNELGVVSGAGANITVAAGADSLLLVDAGLGDRAQELSQLLAARWPDKPVRTVFNSNWRPEHSGANEHFAAAGARVLAHENTRLWMAADFHVAWERTHHEPRPPSALPTDTFYGDGQMDFGARSAQFGYLPRAHTDGDIYVRFPGDNVLAVGDLLAVHGYPAIDHVTGGWLGGMAAATRALLALSDDATRIVASSGAVQPSSALRAQLELCTHVLERLAATYRAGGSLQDFLGAEPAAAFEAQRGDPRTFLELAYEGAYPYVRELGGII